MQEWKKYTLWVAGLTVWATVCFVVPDFIDNPVGDMKALVSVLAYILSVGIFQYFILFILCANRYVCAVTIPVYAVAGAICSYYRLFYHVSITPLLLDAAIHTTVQEAAGVVSARLIVWVLLNTGIALWIGIYRFRTLKTPVPIWACVLAGLIGTGYFYIHPRLHTGLRTRYPIHVINSAIAYLESQNRSIAQRNLPMYQQTQETDSLTVIFIIGESVRADHLQLNGYARATTPRLASRKHIISLPHIYSPYTNTTASVPHIITRADSIHLDYAYTESSFLTIFRQSGFHTAWLSNQDLAKAFYDFLHEPDTTVYTTAAIQQSLYSKWLDSELLPLSDAFIGTHPHQLVVLHTVGSHWLYDTHVTEDCYLFQPTVSNRDVRQNTIGQIVNSYDNSIVYMDRFVDEMIGKIENRPAILIYLSDHGESLGEEGRFLHAQEEAEEAKNPAAFVWYSDMYEQIFPEKVAALQSNHYKHYRTDFLFYSILYAAGIEADGDTPEMNIFR